MWSPADICEQWERNLSFGSADVRGAGTHDEPLRTSAWEATRLMTTATSARLNTPCPEFSMRLKNRSSPIQILLTPHFSTLIKPKH